MPLARLAAALTCLVLTLCSWLTFCCGAVLLYCPPAARVVQAQIATAQSRRRLCSSALDLWVCKASDELAQTFERIVYSLSCFPPPPTMARPIGQGEAQAYEYPWRGGGLEVTRTEVGREAGLG